MTPNKVYTLQKKADVKAKAKVPVTFQSPASGLSRDRWDSFPGMCPVNRTLIAMTTRTVFLQNSSLAVHLMDLYHPLVLQRKVNSTVLLNWVLLCI